MSKTIRNSPNSRDKGRKQRNISVRAVRREPADLRRFSRAVLSIVLAEAEAQADADRSCTAAQQSHLAQSEAPRSDSETTDD